MCLQSVNRQTKKWLFVYDAWDIVAAANELKQLHETRTRGVGWVGHPAVAGLVAVTHHGGSWTNGTFYVHNNSDKSRAGHRGDPAMRGMLPRSAIVTVGRYDYSVPRSRNNLKSAIGNDLCRFSFSSKERDAFHRPAYAGYSGYRFYAPAWQRWLSRDPASEEGGINLYGYVLNNPVAFIDRDGRTLKALLIPLLKRLAPYLAKCKNIRCEVSLHPAHHRFHVVGKKCHIQVLCYIKGQKKSGIRFQIPVPDFLCPGKKTPPTTPPASPPTAGSSSAASFAGEIEREVE